MTRCEVMSAEAVMDAEEAEGAFAGVAASFAERGYEFGYRRAVSEMLAVLLLVAAEHRREHADELGLEAVLAPFVDRLERQLNRMCPPTSDEVYGGLGI